MQCRTSLNGVKEYFISRELNNKRKMISPVPVESTPATKRHKPRSHQNSKCFSDKFYEKPEIKEGAPSIYDVELVGDSHFLNIAIFDLNYEREPFMRRRQAGNCVSGLRIREAAERILEMERNIDEPVKRILVNVGSVDVAEDRMLIEMMNDMEYFLDSCKRMNIIPILTTLAPLPNYVYGRTNSLRIDTLDGFNVYIRNVLSKRCSVIDLNKCMLRKDGSIESNAFQPKPRHVSGSRKMFVMWNKLGRNRVQTMLKMNLGHALVFQRNFIGDYFRPSFGTNF